LATITLSLALDTFKFPPFELVPFKPAALNPVPLRATVGLTKFSPTIVIEPVVKSVCALKIDGIFSACSAPTKVNKQTVAKKPRNNGLRWIPPDASSTVFDVIFRGSSLLSYVTRLCRIRAEYKEVTRLQYKTVKSFFLARNGLIQRCLKVSASVSLR
jgi:hypothetical protein